MSLGIILALAAGGLYWRSFTEKRLLAHFGFAVLSVAVMFSSFRRAVYNPSHMFAQVGLDWVVCSVFFVGAMTLVVDRITERRHARRHGLPVTNRPGLWLLLPMMLLLTAAASWRWGGEDPDALSPLQVAREMQDGKNPSLALDEAQKGVILFLEYLGLQARTGTAEQRAYAEAALRGLAKTIERVQCQRSPSPPRRQ